MNKPKKIVILGIGGNCIDILDTIDDINHFSGQTLYECVGFLDDQPEHYQTKVFNKKVIGPLKIAKELPSDYRFVNGIGSSSNFWKKEIIIKKTGIPQSRFQTIVHPSSSVSRKANIGNGVVIFQNVTITTNATIGNHVMILPNSVISHDDIIGDFSIIAGGVCISGNVTVGKSCYLGSNSTIKENTEIEDYSLVGMGSNVLHKVTKSSVFVGNPAKFLRFIDQ
ncbi:NeuD/PglB/VioB family sugar acetyltransferase [Peribacillus frigoritolerans]|uniref:NeuD/PglB/VioB family sugar acetyltransferase n=1 Tax=Peribacillus TaxID=2675229 RepID=UPI000BA6C358|nr:NeuD/PglB/VioB family sugar acetyltransferase [Peribacillus simplex]PAL11695.1 sugar O-acyltransferase [Peribacillus simplex]